MKIRYAAFLNDNEYVVPKIRRKPSYEYQDLIGHYELAPCWRDQWWLSGVELWFGTYENNV
jgi:hypothetical protein